MLVDRKLRSQKPDGALLSLDLGKEPDGSLIDDHDRSIGARKAPRRTPLLVSEPDRELELLEDAEQSPGKLHFGFELKPRLHASLDRLLPLEREEPAPVHLAKSKRLATSLDRASSIIEELVCLELGRRGRCPQAPESLLEAGPVRKAELHFRFVGMGPIEHRF